MAGRRLVLFLLALVGPPGAGGQETAARVAARTPQADEGRALLHQISEAQRALGDQLQQMRERLDAIQQDLATANDARTALDEEVKAMRDEVKGLYWESSQVKQQIDALKEDLAGVNSNVSNFRTFSGFFIAAMILLLAVIFVMTIRR
jgi:chromosome segregation ATPase